MADEAAPEVYTQAYPPWLADDQHGRWDNAKGIAETLFGDQGPGAVWMATRAIFADPEFAD